MKRIAIVAILVVVATAPILARADDKDKVGDSPYYPLKVGNAWTFTYNGTEKVTLVNKVVKHELVNGVMCARIETLKDGNAIAFDHIAVTNDGIYRYSLGEAKPDKPILVLKLPPKKGDEWTINSKFGNDTVTGKLTTDEVKVSVAAGKYDAFKAGGKVEVGGASVEVMNYFVKDVGIVKITVESGGQTLEFELTKFEPAK